MLDEPGTARTREDACPGALRVHAAADGGLARIRLPGGRISAAQLRAVAESAGALGNGQLELTSRANLQVRGLREGSATHLAESLTTHGLLPSPKHETVRNVIASPCTGLDEAGLADVSRTVIELDAALCASPVLATLPGRFLFTVDDGRGDVSNLGADVGLHAVGFDRFAVLLAGQDTGIRVTADDAARFAVMAAVAFVRECAEEAAPVWRLAELPDGRRRVAAHLPPAGGEPAAPTAGEQVRPGVAARSGKSIAIAAGAPLGRLTRERAHELATVADHGTGELRVTPWRTVLVPGLPAAEADGWIDSLRTSGFVVDADSPWSGMTACTGAPGCAKSLADVQADAARAAASIRPGRVPVHWVGCARRCGSPRGRAVEVLATDAGYDVRLEGAEEASGLDAVDTPAAINAARRTA